VREPLVSIIIPVYNGENYLREAIDSALAQSYPSLEIIVVNDGSNDQGATEKIAAAYGDKIRYLHKENGGVSTALNMGIREMTGEYFSWLSHDDLYYPHKIERQIQQLNQNGDMTTIVHSAYDLLEEPSKTITHVIHSNVYPMEYLTHSVLPVLQGLVHGCSLLIHKSHFERVGVFDDKLVTTQDYDLWFRMMRNQNIIYIGEPLIIGRVHEAQQGRTLSRYQTEREQLHINFLNELSQEEMTSMYGSPYNFYHRMSSFFKGAKMDESYRYANQKLQQAAVPGDLSEKLSSLRKYIKELSDEKADRIAIFCAGEYGMRLYQELRSKLISVDYFSDNNPRKWGCIYEQVDCISPQQLEEVKDRTLVIVATQTPTDIVEQLKCMGFPYVTTKQEIDGFLIKVPPVKWITALDHLDVDYSSKDVTCLMNCFNKTILEMCRYYEDAGEQ
jgi:glycosyltransferase involved in cell wall biosynthesis